MTNTSRSNNKKKEPVTPQEIYDSMVNLALEWNSNNNRSSSMSWEEVEAEMIWEVLNQLRQQILKTGRSIRLMRKVFPDSVGEIDLMILNSGLNGKVRGEFYK